MQSHVAMRYHALAADYDGTLAHHGRIDENTWAALRRLRDSGRKAIMVTGRELDELLSIVPHPEMFDRIVAENGALIYEPATKEIRPTCGHPPQRFVEALRRRGVERLSVGRAIVATWEPHEDAVLHVIHELGLELQVIFNKGAVMVLPSGVNKATGLAAALHELGLSRHNIVGVGDAENDHALLDACECGVAVANALGVLKDRADLVTRGDHGTGVAELIDHLTANDLAVAAPNLRRHQIRIGRTETGDVCIDPYASNVMVCGTSGSGKSTLTTGFLERLCKAGYQFAIVDPEGDYSSLDFAVVLGAHARVPLVSEAIHVLRAPSDNVVVNLLGVGVDHRPEFFTQLLPALSDLRARTGRPHWLVVDEAHHLLPSTWEPNDELKFRPHGTLYVTVHPGAVAPGVIETINTVLAVGDHPDDAIRDFCATAHLDAPLLAVEHRKLPAGQALYWRVGAPRAVVIHTEPPKIERKRHSRKYLEGNLGNSRSFYFHGPDRKLNLKAHNVLLFLHLGDGVDDETWSYHLRRGDYSRWFRSEVKDAELAEEIELIEHDLDLTPAASRAKIRRAVDKRYTLPADKPSGVVDA